MRDNDLSHAFSKLLSLRVFFNNILEYDFSDRDDLMDFIDGAIEKFGLSRIVISGGVAEFLKDVTVHDEKYLYDVGCNWSDEEGANFLYAIMDISGDIECEVYVDMKSVSDYIIFKHTNGKIEYRVNVNIIE